MSFYSDLAAIAAKLLKQFGQAATVTYKTAAAYDPTQGQSSVTTTTQSGYGALFDYTGRIGGEQREPGTLVASGQRQLLLSNVAVTPNVDDYVTLGGVKYTIMKVRKISPAGVTVIYDLDVVGAP